MLCLISTIYYTIFHLAYFNNRPKFNCNRGGKLQSMRFSYARCFPHPLPSLQTLIYQCAAISTVPLDFSHPPII